VQVLNNIVDFAGLSGSQTFTKELIAGVRGFPGGYKTTNFTAEDNAAMHLLREYFQKPQEDLKALVDTLYPHINFTVHLES
jgi:hypothetical protein